MELLGQDYRACSVAAYVGRRRRWTGRGTSDRTAVDGGSCPSGRRGQQGRGHAGAVCRRRPPRAGGDPDRWRTRRHPQPGDGPARGARRGSPTSAATRWPGRPRSSVSSTAGWGSSTPVCRRATRRRRCRRAVSPLVPLEEPVAELVKVIREFRPHVMTTYDENGGYPHPDHIRCHQVSVAAFEAAADRALHPEAGPPWAVSKLYYNHGFLRQRMQMLQDEFAKNGQEGPFARWLENWDPEKDPVAKRVTTRVHCAALLPRRDEALKAHATQIDPDGFFFATPIEWQQRLWPTEEFELARSRVPADATGRRPIRRNRDLRVSYLLTTADPCWPRTDEHRAGLRQGQPGRPAGRCAAADRRLHPGAVDEPAPQAGAEELRRAAEHRAGRGADGTGRDDRQLGRRHRKSPREPSGNELAGATSPYLRQHADNPVHWQQWSARGARRGGPPRRADPALDRLCRLPLVSRDGPRVLRGRRGGRGDEPASSASRSTARSVPTSTRST